jgi:hypothetical protein
MNRGSENRPASSIPGCTRVTAAFDRQEVDCALVPFVEAAARIARAPMEQKYCRNCTPRPSGLQTQAKIGLALGSVAAPPGGGEADEQLAKLGLAMGSLGVVPQFSDASLIVANSGLVTLAHERGGIIVPSCSIS